MIKLCGAVAALTFGLALGGTPALAGEPTVTPAPSATPTAGAAPEVTINAGGLSGRLGSSTQVTWNAVPGAASYEVTASVTVVSVNPADPFCSPPVARRTETVTLERSVAAAETSLPVELPAIAAPDVWFGAQSRVTLRALDTSGAEITGAATGSIGETTCVRGVPTAVSSPRPAELPATGRPDAPGSGTRVAVTAVVVLVGALMTLGGVVHARRGRGSAARP